MAAPETATLESRRLWIQLPRPLWIEQGLGLPFAPEDAVFRWIVNGIAPLRPAIGNRMKSIMIGRGEMTWDGREIEFWT